MKNHNPLTFPTLGIGLALIGHCYADRLVSIPIGRKIPYGSYRLETMSGLNSSGSTERFFGIGLTNIFDIEFRNRTRPSLLNQATEDAFTFDLSANLLSPIAETAPGVSVGILDATNRTLDGRRAYVAITFLEYFETERDAYKMQIHLGAQWGSRNSAFIGVNLPLTTTFSVLLEHNGFRPTIGVEMKPLKNVAIRLLNQDRTSIGSVSWTGRF